MSSTKAQKIKRRTLVGGCLALALAGLLWLAYLPSGTWLVFGVGVALAALSVAELTRMGRFRELALAPALMAGFGAACFMLGAWLGRASQLGLQLQALSTWLAAALVGAMVGTLLPPPVGRERVNATRLAVLAAWIAPALPALALIRAGFGADGLVALIVLSKLGDIAGYYVGSAIGKHHPFPNVSPGKTTAGCVASLVAGTLGGAACVAFELLPAGPLGIAGGLVAGAVVNLAAQAGDLFESRAKRQAGVKDSGTWFGPSGGVLDLVDSLLLSVPAACLTWPFLFPSP